MKKILYTGGTFDLLHPGHLNFLRTCKEKADVVVVALNTDAFCHEYKKRLPTLDFEERRECLLACKYVDAVVANVGGYDSRISIEVVKPDYIAHGDDWTGEKYLEQLGISKEYLKEYGIKLFYVPYYKGLSTTEILNRIKLS